MSEDSYNEGRYAYKLGWCVDDNPYVTYSPSGNLGGLKASAWLEGWWSAYDDEKDVLDEST